MAEAGLSQRGLCALCLPHGIGMKCSAITEFWCHTLGRCLADIYPLVCVCMLPQQFRGTELAFLDNDADGGCWAVGRCTLAQPCFCCGLFLLLMSVAHSPCPHPKCPALYSAELCSPTALLPVVLVVRNHLEMWH